MNQPVTDEQRDQLLRATAQFTHAMNTYITALLPAVQAAAGHLRQLHDALQAAELLDEDGTPVPVTTDEPERPVQPWCCRNAFAHTSECPLCPEYGTRLDTRCPGHDDTPGNRLTVTTAALHARCAYPGWEYATTEGPRKQWESGHVPPCGDDPGACDHGWEPNVDAGRPGAGWERFDYTEEAYWRRRTVGA